MGDPAQSVFYRVTLDGFIPLGIWTKIEGLGYEYQVTEYREGGVNGYTHKIVGPCKYTNLRLTRPVDSESALVSIWLAANLITIIPQTMSITAMDSTGADIATWNLVGVVPVKWTGPTLDILSNALATETLEVAYEQIIGLGTILGGAVAGALTASASVSVSF
jgi:phage tail-like protein